MKLNAIARLQNVHNYEVKSSSHKGSCFKGLCSNACETQAFETIPVKLIILNP